MAATYFKISTDKHGETTITSQDKRNKKIGISISHRFLIAFDLNPANEINTLFQVSSFEINTDLLTLNNFKFNKKNRSTLNIAAGNIELDSVVDLSMPGIKSSLIFGISDNDCSLVANRDEFINRQKTCYPFYNDTKVPAIIDVPFIDKKNAFERHTNYLNVFTEISTFQTGDIEPYYILANALMPAGYTLVNFTKEMNIFIDGVVE